MSGSTERAPASKARKVPWAGGIATPPTIPTMPDSLMAAAAIPAR